MTNVYTLTPVHTSRTAQLEKDLTTVMSPSWSKAAEASEKKKKSKFDRFIEKIFGAQF